MQLRAGLKKGIFRSWFDPSQPGSGIEEEKNKSAVLVVRGTGYIW